MNINWNDNEPNNAGGKEHCMQFEAQDNNYGINDGECEWTFSFICTYTD